MLLKYAKTLIFIPSTLTVVDIQSFFVEKIKIIDEIVDGDNQWILSNGIVVHYDERTDFLSFVNQKDGMLLERHTIPQQVTDDAPLYWSNTLCFWVEAHCDSLLGLPYLADDDAIASILPGNGQVYDLLKHLESFPSEFGVWVARDLDTENGGGVLRTRILNDEDMMFEVNSYLEGTQNDCVLTDEYINDALSFVGLPFADSVKSTENKMVLHCLGGLSMTRLS